MTYDEIIGRLRIGRRHTRRLRGLGGGVACATCRQPLSTHKDGDVLLVARHACPAPAPGWSEPWLRFLADDYTP